MKLSEIAARVNCPFTGSGDVVINAIRSVEQAREGDLAFIVDRKHEKFIATSHASAFILSEDFPPIDRPTIRTSNPYFIFSLAQRLFYHQPLPEGPFIHPTAVLAGDLVHGDGCYIGPHVVIGAGCRLGNRVRILANTTLYDGVEVGDDSLIHSNCVVREYCQLGRNVILQNGVVLGGDGFGFAKDDQGVYQKILQAGRVIVEDDVEIQANTCVDRGTLDDTRIGRGTKLDNLIQIGHGSEIGENCVLAGQVGLAGSTKVGNSVMMGGQVGVAGHCIIGDNVVVLAQAGIVTDVEKNKVIAGAPAIDSKEYKKAILSLFKLHEMMNRFRQIEKAFAGKDKKDG